MIRLLNAVSRRPISYLLKNARIVNADLSENHQDLFIENGKIASIVPTGATTAQDVQSIDCSNKLLIPGGIDTHTHLQLPFMGTSAIDDFDTGTKAALAGGTTCVIDFAIPNKGQPMMEAYKQWRQWADPNVNCDYGLHAAIVDWNENTADQMRRLVKEEGVTSFKFFMAYNNVLRIDDNSMFKAFQCARQLGAVCLVHAENGDLIEFNQKKLLEKGITGPQGHYLSRPESIEAQAVHRVITIAEHTNCPVYIVHVMSREAAEQVQRAKNRGLLVHAQTLAATIGTDGRHLWNKNWDIASRYVMSPPLNPDPQTKTHILKHLNTGTLQVVGTDNCTFCTDQKRMGKESFTKIPNGVNGIQDRLAVVWTKGVKSGLLSENKFVEVTSTNAAKIFNMYPRKGALRVGADADVVVWDPNVRRTISAATHHQKVDYNVFEGMEVFGKAVYTFSGGRMVWNGSEFVGTQKGRYLKRQPFGHVYGRHSAWVTANDPINRKVDRSTNSPTSNSQHQNSSSNSNSQIEALRRQLQATRKSRQALLARVNALEKDQSTHFSGSQLIDTYKSLETYLPPKVFSSVRQILYGPETPSMALKPETVSRASQLGVEVKAYNVPCPKEQVRSQRLVKIGAVQNKIVLKTSEPVIKQKHAIMERIGQIIELAALEGVNILCLQEIWTAPFFMCTRERYPWVEFSEPFDGESTQFIRKLAKRHNMVIVSSILQRDRAKETLHNTAVIIGSDGNILGRQEKGHIPRVGDFNESTYYMEGNSGHPVFDTRFGRIGVNICYGRHHPLHWMGFGLNGAEIVFNPSATINGLSEPLWGIEARNASIANHYFTVGINRIGTETYPNQFTSGDARPSKHDFGHFYGSSYLAAPDGSRTPSLSRTSDGLLISQIDLNMCRQVKDKWCFTMTGRHELYAELLKDYIKEGFKPQMIYETREDEIKTGK